MNSDYMDNMENVADEQVPVKRSYRSRQILAILKIYSALGFLLAIFGFTWFLLLKLDIHLTTSESYALLVSVCGIFIIAMSYMGAVFIKNKNIIFGSGDDTASKRGHFIGEWIRFENLARSLVKSSSNEGHNQNLYSMKALFNGLIDIHQITLSQANQLGRILALRNDMVHGVKNINNEEMCKAIKFLENINTALDRKYMRNPE